MMLKYFARCALIGIIVGVGMYNLLGFAQVPQTSNIQGYVGIGLEFDSTGKLIGADILGFAENQHMCQLENSQIMAKAYEEHKVPKGDILASSCLPGGTPPKKVIEDNSPKDSNI